MVEPRSRDPHLELFTSVVELRNLELNTLWARFNIHLILNGGLLIAGLSAPDTAFLAANRGTVCVFGLALSLIWLGSERAGRRSLKHRDEKIREFEETFWPATPFETFKLFRERPPTLRLQEVVSLAVVCLFVGAWAFLYLTRG